MLYSAIFFFQIFLVYFQSPFFGRYPFSINLVKSFVSVCITFMCLFVEIFNFYPNRTYEISNDTWELLLISFKFLNYIWSKFFNKKKTKCNFEVNKWKKNPVILTVVNKSIRKLFSHQNIQPCCKSLKHIFDGLFIWYENYPGK